MTIKYAKTSFYTQGTNNKGGVVRCKKTIEVVYEKGVFKPLEKVELKE